MKRLFTPFALFCSILVSCENDRVSDISKQPSIPPVVVEAIDLGLSVKWASCNVGATKPEEYGDYFAWGETSPKKEYTEDNCLTWWMSVSDISGNPQYDAATSNWGGNWRMPTEAEMFELYNDCRWVWTTLNGVNGMEVTGPNGNSIFLPATGFRRGSLSDFVGSLGEYWCSTPYLGNDRACSLHFDYEKPGWGWATRDYGRSVRPVSKL